MEQTAQQPPTAVALYRQPDTLLARVDELQVPITAIDRKLINASGIEPGSKVVPLAKLPLKGSDGAIALVGALLKGVFRDLGIAQEPDQYDGARFLQAVKDYFPKLSVNDIKVAFELYVLHELDKFLPMQKGKVIAHYQQFSMSFWSEVLRAYQRRQGEAMIGVSQKVSTLLLEQRNEDNYGADRVRYLRMLRWIVYRFCQAKGEARLPLLVDRRLCQLMVRLKVLKEVPTPTKADKEKSMEELSRGKSWTIARIYHRALNGGLINDELDTRAFIICARKAISEGLLKCDSELVIRRIGWLIDETKAKHHLK